MGLGKAYPADYLLVVLLWDLDPERDNALDCGVTLTFLGKALFNRRVKFVLGSPRLVSFHFPAGVFPCR